MNGNHEKSIIGAKICKISHSCGCVKICELSLGFRIMCSLVWFGFPKKATRIERFGTRLPKSKCMMINTSNF